MHWTASQQLMYYFNSPFHICYKMVLISNNIKHYYIAEDRKHFNQQEYVLFGYSNWKQYNGDIDNSHQRIIYTVVSSSYVSVKKYIYVLKRLYFIRPNKNTTVWKSEFYFMLSERYINYFPNIIFMKQIALRYLNIQKKTIEFRI